MPFREIAGHRHLFELMSSAAGRGTLPPSLIFAGPDGVGKRMAAVALAQLLNCRTPVAMGEGALDACGVCSSCTRIARGVHADVLLIEPGETGAIKVDQVRDAIERSAYRPFEGRRRVVIIDDADAILGEAQNALLKTLEEPPAASMFVLVTARPDLLLPTVRSRCQRLRFGRLSPGDIAAVLIERHGYQAADAHASAAASDGSIGAALEGGSDAFVEAREAAARLLQGVAGARDPGRRLDGAKVLGGGTDREALATRLRAVSSLLRDLAALLTGASDTALANADLAGDLRRILPAFDGRRTLQAFAAVDRALDALERNASPKIVADWVAFQI